MKQFIKELREAFQWYWSGGPFLVHHQAMASWYDHLLTEEEEIKMSQSKILFAFKGPGKELYEQMREVLGIPHTAQHVTIEIKDQVFTVTCTYLAADNSAEVGNGLTPIDKN